MTSPIDLDDVARLVSPIVQALAQDGKDILAVSLAGFDEPVTILVGVGLIYLTGGPIVLLFWVVAFPFFLVGLVAEKVGKR